MKVKDLVRIIRSSHKNKFVYHFTDNKNLAAIRKHGILSKREQDRLGVIAENPGGDTVSIHSDRLNGTDDDVSLCLWKKHPMAYKCKNDGRHPDQVFLKIEPSVLQLEGVRASLTLANVTNARIQGLSEVVGTIGVDILYKSSWCDDYKNRITAAEKVEVLIPKKVPLEFIKGKFLSKD